MFEPYSKLIQSCDWPMGCKGSEPIDYYSMEVTDTPTIQLEIYAAIIF